jgi:hypothetical protein
MQCFCKSRRIRNLLVMVLKLKKFLKLAETIVRIYPDQAAQAEHQVSPPSTVFTPLLACCWQYQRRPFSIAPNFHAERSSPQAAGDLNISNYTILNFCKLHGRRIWLVAVCPNVLNLLSILKSMRTNIQWKSWTQFPTSNTLKTSQTHSFNHCHLPYRG